MSIHKDIYRAIKKYNTIVIARHVGADPDALSSQLALRDTIKETFSNKNVYAVGTPVAKFKYIGLLDKIDDIDISRSLLILTDTPNASRVDGVNVSDFAYSIKIDHHPFIETFCNLEWIDDTACSASEMVGYLIYNTRLKLTRDIAEKLYVGIVADTNRFLFSYTSFKTFDLVSKFIKDTNMDFTKLYNFLYLRNISEIKFEAYITNNMIITENGFGYIKLGNDILKEYNIDAATASTMVNNYNYIDKLIAWAIFSYDEKNDNIRGSIRSRGPIVNKIAAEFNGGGHAFASGVKLKDFTEVDDLVKSMDELCLEYQKI